MIPASKSSPPFRLRAAFVSGCVPVSSRSQLLLDALLALRKWVDRNGAAVTRYSVLADLSEHLEMLMSQSTEQRQRSYAELTKFLPKAPTTDLAPIDTYARRCHRLHGGTDHMHGVWCDIFSAIEREAYVKARAQHRPFY